MMNPAMPDFDDFLSPMCSTLERLCELNAHSESCGIPDSPGFTASPSPSLQQVPASSLPSGWAASPKSSSAASNASSNSQFASPSVTASVSGCSSPYTNSSSHYSNHIDDCSDGSPPNPIRKAPVSPSRFHASTKPAISIRDYLARINAYADCTPTCFVLCLVYVDRLIQSNTVCVDEMTIHRLLITGVAVAAKFFDDLHYTNSHYARVGGIQLPEFNELEVQFLFALNFNLHVEPDTFNLYLHQLTQIASKNTGGKNDLDQKCVGEPEENTTAAAFPSKTAPVAAPSPKHGNGKKYRHHKKKYHSKKHHHKHTATTAAALSRA